MDSRGAGVLRFLYLECLSPKTHPAAALNPVGRSFVGGKAVVFLCGTEQEDQHRAMQLLTWGHTWGKWRRCLHYPTASTWGRQVGTDFNGEGGLFFVPVTRTHLNRTTQHGVSIKLIRQKHFFVSGNMWQFYRQLHCGNFPGCWCVRKCKFHLDNKDHIRNSWCCFQCFGHFGFCLKETLQKKNSNNVYDPPGEDLCRQKFS